MTDNTADVPQNGGAEFILDKYYCLYTCSLKMEL